MSGNWTCTACSTANVAADAFCVVCHIARPAPARTVVDPTTDTPRVPIATTIRPSIPSAAPAPPTTPAGQGGVPLAPGPGRGGAPTWAPEGPAPKQGVPVAALAAVVILILAVVGVVVVVGGSKGNDEVSTETSEPYVDDSDTIDTVDATDTLDTADTVDTTETVATTAPAPTTRTAQLFSSYAKIRTEPRLASAPAGEFSHRENMSIDVIGEPTADGWYKVTIEGKTGYLFGAFVRPPAAGFCVTTSIAATPTVYDDSGYAISDEKSGNKVLITASTPDYDGWPVVLPGGRRGHVPTSDVNEPECG